MTSSSRPAAATRQRASRVGAIAVAAVLVTLVVTLPSASQGPQVAALHTMMRTVNAGDAAGYAGLYAEDAVIKIFGTGDLRGRAAIEEHERDLLRQFPGTRLSFYTVWQDGREAVVHYAVNGRTPAGQAMGHDGLLFYRFSESGLIEEERRYLDSVTPMAQLGLVRAPVRPLPQLAEEVTVHTATGSTGLAGDVALVKAAIEALDGEDQGAFLSRLADDAVVNDAIFPTPFTGTQQVQHWVEQWSGAVSDVSSRIESIRNVGTFVLVETIMRGTLVGELAGVSASNRPFTVHRGLIAHVAHDKIARLSSFMNRKELADAVGHALIPHK